MDNMEVITKSARESQKLGEKLASTLKKGSVLCLYGDLGSGKTTFLQGLAHGLGIKERILSPTFVMMRQYEISNKKDASCFYHIDLYRAENEKDVESLNLREIWSDPQNIIAIEWPEKIEKILPSERINLHFEYLKENERRITIKP